MLDGLFKILKFQLLHNNLVYRVAAKITVKYEWYLPNSVVLGKVELSWELSLSPAPDFPSADTEAVINPV